MLTKEQYAGQEYSDAVPRARRGADGDIWMLATHIIIMIKGSADFPGPLWRRREVPPDGRVMELENFKDYLLEDPRHGLGFKSLSQVDLLMKSNEDKGTKALELIRKEIPEWDELIQKEARRAANRAANTQADTITRGGNNNPAGVNQHKSGDEVNHDNVMIDHKTGTEQGNSTSYTLRRLARNHPELLERFAAGELTANQAAIKAGFRKPTWTAPCEPDALARSIVKKFGPDFARQLKDAL
jgi:hypothetical protein